MSNEQSLKCLRPGGSQSKCHAAFFAYFLTKFCFKSPKKSYLLLNKKGYNFHQMSHGQGGLKSAQKVLHII